MTRPGGAKSRGSRASGFGRPRVIACCGLILIAVWLGACAPEPTATPALVPASPTRAVPTVRLLGTAIPRETPLPALSPTVQVANATQGGLPTARARVYEDVDQLQILQAVFPNLALDQQPDGYLVENNVDWKVWVNDREEGRITQADEPELLAVIASVVGSNPPREAAAFGPSSAFLVILRRRDNKLEVVRRDKIFPAISPLAIDARIERVVDVDHDGQDELLTTTNTVQSLITRTEAHLYRWEGDQVTELWKGFEVNDNTAAVNQTEYSSYEATLEFSDLDNNGVDEIVVNATRTSYPKDAQGRADLSAPSSVAKERSVYKWNGETYVLDPSQTTPAASTPSP